MKLPNLEKAVVPREKIVDYLLSFIHKDGRAKAEFFTRFGFADEHWGVFADALKCQAANSEVGKIEATPFGMRYIIEGEIETPDQCRPKLRVIRFIETDTDTPRLVTACPLKEKQ